MSKKISKVFILSMSIQKKMNKLLILLLFISSSCSFFTKKVESLTFENVGEVKKNLSKQTYCSNNAPLQFIFEDDSAEKFYSTFATKVFKNSKFSFIQKTVLLSLIEMSRRPDIASPTSRFQYFLHLDNKDYYFDFFPKTNVNNSIPLLKGLSSLLNQFDHSIKLQILAENLDSIVPSLISVSADLETFLKKNKNEISKNKKLSDLFIKGNDSLTKLESFKRSFYTSIIQSSLEELSKKDEIYFSVQKPLTNVETNTRNVKIECNFKLSNDSLVRDDSIFADSIKSHSFGIKEGNNYFLGIASGEIDNPVRNFQSLGMIKTSPSHSPIPICHLKNDEHDIIIISNKGRSPAQHLEHLLDYELASIDNFSSLQELLKFSRHIFLSNPDRILYESKRGRKNQLDFFLTMNFHIYHVEELGNLIGFANYKDAHQNSIKSLFVDDRSLAQLWCK